VWAAITSGEKYQDSNLPLLRILKQGRRLGEPGFTGLINENEEGGSNNDRQALEGIYLRKLNFLIKDA
jgi:hypothetical protein